MLIVKKFALGIVAKKFKKGISWVAFVEKRIRTNIQVFSKGCLNWRFNKKI